MFRELPEPIGNDRNAENFRHCFADPWERVLAQGRGGPSKHLRSRLPQATGELALKTESHLGVLI